MKSCSDRTNRSYLVLSLAGAMCLAWACPARGAEPAPRFLPTPKSVTMHDGVMPIAPGGRVIAADENIKPLAEVFSREILAMTGVKLEVASGEAKAGDIVLKINPAVRADQDILAVQKREVVKTRDLAHTIEVGDTTVVEGWDYRATCEGTATLLQSLRQDGGKWVLPKMSIKDWPFADYTGYMLDVARQGVPIVALKDAVIAMRYWKVRYLHLHFSDDSALVYPLRKYPDAGKFNGAINNGDNPLRKYPDAGKFNGAINNGDMTKVWDREELKKLVAFADERGVTLVPEFETPAHCGSYQSALGGAQGDPGFRMMDIANDNIYPTLEEIVDDLCEVFKSSPFIHIGGDEIQWDWYANAPHVKAYLKAHNMREIDKGGKDDLLKQHVLRMNEFIKKRGKKTIYWGGYQGPPLDPAMTDCIVYSWYLGAIEAQKNGFTTITVPWEISVPFEKWNIFSCNKEMLQRTDRVLGGSRVAWECGAETYVLASIYEAQRQEGTWAPDTVSPSVKDLQDREKLQAAQLSRILNAAAIKAEGAVEGDTYSGELTVTMPTSTPAGCTVHYTTNGDEPTVKSAKYEKPLKLTGSLRLRGAMFDAGGALVGGYAWAQKYNYRGHEENLTTGKPVTTTGGVNPQEKPEFANDGWVDLQKFWGTIPAPKSWTVDLQKEYTLDRIRVFPYWDEKRYYQYTVDVSTDGEKWTQVVDDSKNTTPEVEQGREHKFKASPARYVRVNMLKNSDNDAVHLVEVRVYEAGK
ncbi:MAG: family 20 glycosylhydrolase [Planctomycetota bacterium]|nr:family 20 glycosylhydrolase [Planctomycetota bacterium]